MAEARSNLEEALALFFEAASTEGIKERLRREVYVTQVEVSVGRRAHAQARPEMPSAVKRVDALAEGSRRGAVTTNPRIARMVDQLGTAVPIGADDCPAVPKRPGLYMFTEAGRVMWVGTASPDFSQT